MPEATAGGWGAPLQSVEGRSSVGGFAAGAQIQIAPLERADSDAVLAMFGRCSPVSLFRRFHGVTDGVWYVTRLLAGATGERAYGAWIAGRCVGLASANVYDKVSAEIAVLVEDDWQRRGVGAALLAVLVSQARQHGLVRLRADVLTANGFIPPALTRLGPTRASTDREVHTVWVDLEPVETEVKEGAA